MDRSQVYATLRKGEEGGTKRLMLNITDPTHEHKGNDIKSSNAA